MIEIRRDRYHESFEWDHVRTVTVPVYPLSLPEFRALRSERGGGGPLQDDFRDYLRFGGYPCRA